MNTGYYQENMNNSIFFKKGLIMTTRKMLLEQIEMQIDVAIMKLTHAELLKKDGNEKHEESNVIATQIEHEIYMLSLEILRLRLIRTINVLKRFENVLRNESEEKTSLYDIVTDVDFATLSVSDKEFLKDNGIIF